MVFHSYEVQNQTKLSIELEVRMMATFGGRSRGFLMKGRKHEESSGAGGNVMLLDLVLGWMVSDYCVTWLCSFCEIKQVVHFFYILSIVYYSKIYKTNKIKLLVF